MRLLPHDQNTGGFFVCVLEKVLFNGKPESDAVKAAKRAASPSTPEGAREGKKVKSDEAEPDAEDPEAVPVEAVAEAGSVMKEKKDWSYREDPFSYVDSANPELESIW
jgi:multisite-specific tRNA:(cytosine-C5)-methyltransferase